jgi:hypothetical protein
MSCQSLPKPATLTGRQLRAVAAVAASTNLVEAARVAKVGERSLRRWITLPPFLAAVEAARTEATTQTLRSLEQALSAAVACLRELLTPDTPPNTRRAAASDLLKHGLASIELRQISERLDAIERRLAE